MMIMEKMMTYMQYLISWIMGNYIVKIFICYSIAFEFLFYEYRIITWNFHHGHPLGEQKNTPLILRTCIFIYALMLISIKAKIFLSSMIFLFLGWLVKHIENQILPKYKDNQKLHTLYVSEIDRMKDRLFIIVPTVYIVCLVAGFMIWI